MNPKLRFHFCDDPQTLSRAAAAAFVASAREVLTKRSRFTVALAGGSTPKTLYSLLTSEFRSAVEWSRVHFFWTDERFVPRDAIESNYRMVHEALVRPLGLPAGNVHAPDTSLLDPSDSSRQYEQAIRTFFGTEFPRFDWILLGMGEDGHVASLFPGSAALEESSRLVTTILKSPKPPPVRLTMTLPLLNAGRELHFLVSGRRKNSAFLKILAQENADLPAQQIRPNEGVVDWWVDADAARGATPPPKSET